MLNVRVRADLAPLLFLLSFPLRLSDLGNKTAGDSKALLVIAMPAAAVIFASRPGTGALAGWQVCGY